MNKNNKQVLLLLLGILISGVLALGLYLLLEQIITTQYVDRVGIEGRSVSIDKFCNKYDDQKNGNSSKIILLVGSSNTNSNINATLMMQYLVNITESNKSRKSSLSNSYTIYNLAITGSDPIAQSVFIDCYIKFHPSLVIMGVNQYSFNGDINSDMVLALSKRLNANKEYINQPFISLGTKEVLNYNFLQKAYYKRKYFIQLVIIGPYQLLRPFTHAPSLLDVYTSNVDGVGGINIPYDYEIIHSTAEIERSLYEDNILTNLNNISFNNNSELQSFEYLAKSLKSHNISLIVINYPMHSILLKHMDEERASVYADYMNNDATKYGFEYMDLKYLYVTNDSYFSDKLHLTFNGRNDFTVLITNELINKGSIN